MSRTYPSCGTMFPKRDSKQRNTEGREYVSSPGFPRRLSARAFFPFVSSSGISAQDLKVFAPHNPVPPRVEKPLPNPRPAALQSVVGGLWMIDANFKSSIYLRNNNEVSPITATPILYLSKAGSSLFRTLCSAFR